MSNFGLVITGAMFLSFRVAPVPSDLGRLLDERPQELSSHKVELLARQPATRLSLPFSSLLRSADLVAVSFRLDADTEEVVDRVTPALLATDPPISDAERNAIARVEHPDNARAGILYLDMHKLRSIVREDKVTAYIGLSLRPLPAEGRTAVVYVTYQRWSQDWMWGIKKWLAMHLLAAPPRCSS